MASNMVTFKSSETDLNDVSWFVKSSSRAYEIVLSNTPFDVSLISDYDVVIVDDYFRYLIPQSNKVFFLKMDEVQKSFETYQKILDFFLHLKLNKSSKILAIGGGVMHDVCGFAASSYARGIHWTYVPTTLVSMVDVCVGGKCAINYKLVKNILGAIYPPHQVLICPEFLQSLSISNISSGLIEALKTAFLGNSLDQFNRVVDIKDSKINVDLKSVIELSLKIKSTIVEIDEFDQNIRQNLNVGHTIGHAIESATHHQIEHGLAVGLGILAELLLYRQFSESSESDIECFKSIIISLLDMNKDSLKALKDIDITLFEKALKMDKKNKGGKIAFAWPCARYVPSQTYPSFQMRTSIQYVEIKDLDVVIKFLKEYE